MAGGLPLTPWAADLKKKRMAVNDKDNPDANCLPMGLTQFHMHGQPRKIMQDSRAIAIMYEANYGLRYIYIDGRKLPGQGSVNPFWNGYSVGHWEGDTLVVETNNLRGAETGPSDGWLTRAGARIRIRRSSSSASGGRDTGNSKSTSRSRTRKVYTKPFTLRVNQQISPDDEVIEFICNENNQFRQRIKID